MSIDGEIWSDTNTGAIHITQEHQSLGILDASVLAAMLTGSHRNASALFPVGTRLVSADNRSLLYEEKPRYLRVTYGKDPETREALVHHVAVPWTVLAMRWSARKLQAQLFCRPGPITSLDDPLFLFPWPNIAQNGSMAHLVSHHETVMVRGILSASSIVWAALCEIPARFGIATAVLAEGQTFVSPADWMESWQEQDVKTIMIPKYCFSATVADIWKTYENELPENYNGLIDFLKTLAHGEKKK